MNKIVGNIIIGVLAVTCIVLYLRPTLQSSSPALGESRTEALEESQIEQEILDKIAIYQAQYLKDNGKYWQGIETHSAPPSDSVRLAPNDFDKKPDGTAEGWADTNIFEKTAKLPFSVEVYEFSTEEGPGYSVMFKAIRGGVEMRKAIGYGPTAEEVSYPWTEFKDWTDPANF